MTLDDSAVQNWMIILVTLDDFCSTFHVFPMSWSPHFDEGMSTRMLENHAFHNWRNLAWGCHKQRVPWQNRAPESITGSGSGSAGARSWIRWIMHENNRYYVNAALFLLFGTVILATKHLSKESACRQGTVSFTVCPHILPSLAWQTPFWA